MVAAASLTPSAAAQVHGMRASAPAFQAVARQIRRRRHSCTWAPDFNRPLLLSSPYFYPDYDYDYEPLGPKMAPFQVVVRQPAQAPAAVASPIKPLLMEYHDGRWVRIPNNGQQAESSQSTQADSGQASSPRQAVTAPKEVAPTPPEIPPTVVVFREAGRKRLKSIRSSAM